MKKKQKVEVANRLLNEMEIDLFDEDGFVCLDEVDEMLTIIKEVESGKTREPERKDH